MSKKTALITGASSGIGEATARRLARAGFDLILVARREDRLRELARGIGAGVEVKTVSLDVGDRRAVEDFFQGEQARLANLTVLVNNAGLARGTEKAQDARLEAWDEMIDTNVKGLMAMSRLALPFLISRRGHIVNLGSVAGRWVYPGGAVYCASKFAVRAFTEGLRMDLAGTGVRVTNIAPGMVETEFSLVRFGTREQADRVYQGMTPLSADDIAESIEWCLQRPAHVDIQELVIFPTDQAAVGQVHRPLK
ncbi:MAG: SDR family NAD(P)-dependent oxidoreductase [Bdellovibrionaceae bacterium]|nr:SDR family NAD(P)-dependent oxidoreductase [Pseudobdellovibrionaceae bacterium]